MPLRLMRDHALEVWVMSVRLVLLSACTKGHRNSSFSGSGSQTLARTGITWENVCKNVCAWAPFCRVHFGGVFGVQEAAFFQNSSDIDASGLTACFEKQCFKVWNCCGKSVLSGMTAFKSQRYNEKPI